MSSRPTVPSRSTHIAFVGDVHGCVFHALHALQELQKRRAITLAAVIQVGDLGAYPDPDRLDADGRRFVAANPAQGNFFRLLSADPVFSTEPWGRAVLDRLRESVPPVLFVSGNHDDVEWLDGLHAKLDAPIVSVDPAGLYRHVRSGHVGRIAGQRVACLGGIEATAPEVVDESVLIDPVAYARLWREAPGSVDVLVTHDGPYGMSTWRGEVQGSPKISRLIERLRPRLHVSGHYHHTNGPRRYGRTTSYSLAQLVPPKQHPEDDRQGNPDQSVSPGSIALFEPDSGEFEYVDDAWLAHISGEVGGEFSLP